jgi:DNA-binding HxlR family transcriptional regulator
MKTKKSNLTAPFAYEGLDRVIHERARLSVLTSLITHADGLAFVELKRLCDLTDGNLARHLQVLEEDGMVRVVKEEGPGRSLTTVRITSSGRKRYLDYLAVLEQIVRDATPRQQDTKNQFSKTLSPLKT